MFKIVNKYYLRVIYGFYWSLTKANSATISITAGICFGEQRSCGFIWGDESQLSLKSALLPKSQLLVSVRLV